MPVDVNQLRIIHYPEPILREKAQPVDPTDAELRAVAERMFELMEEAEGLGLAAPQVGLPWRLFVTEARDDEPRRVFVNPEIIGTSNEAETAEEGCLSLPNVHVEVRRPKQVTIRARDLEGEAFTVTRDDLSARVWQHEFDHVEGILIIDRMGPMDRLANRRAIKDLKAAAGP